MAANIRSGTIATLAALFIVAPLPSDGAASRPPQVVVQRAQPDRPIAMPSFPVPTLRTIGVSYTEPVLLGFAGSLEPVAIAEDTEVPAMRGSLGPDAKTPTETLEFPQIRPSVPIAQVLAALNLAQPAERRPAFGATTRRISGRGRRGGTASRRERQVAPHRR